jgi:HSP20 family molecular chaperone IbpA
MSCPGFYNLMRQQPTEPIDVIKDGGAYIITTRVPVEGDVRVLITCRGGESLVEVMAFGYYNYTTIKDCVRPVGIAYRNYVLTIRLVRS